MNLRVFFTTSIMTLESLEVMRKVKKHPSDNLTEQTPDPSLSGRDEMPTELSKFYLTEQSAYICMKLYDLSNLKRWTV